MLLYSNTYNHAYVLDDFSVIKDNFVVKRGLDGITTIWKTHYRYGYGYSQANLYRPLSLTIFAIQWEFFPDSPSFAHLFNILCYSILGIIIFIFIKSLLGIKHEFLAFLTAILFIAHPIHTEVVANIKSVDDILTMIFSLVGILLLFKYIENKVKKYLIASLVLFTLSFLCKESTITLVAIIPLCLLLFRSYSIKDAFKVTSWYLLPFLVYLSLRIKVLGSISGDKTIAKLDNLLMAAPSELHRIATAIKILGLYLWKLILPHPLMNDYSINQIEIVGFGNIHTLISLIIYSGLIYLMIYFWKRNPLISFSIGFYLVTIFLYSNLVFTIGTSFGERLLFIPSLGFCLLIAYLIHYPFREKINPNKLVKSAKTPLLIVSSLVLIYSFKTIDRNKAWKDNYTLYSTDVINCNKSARCHYYHGLGLMKEKALVEKNQELKKQYILNAINAFNKSIQILPSYSDAWGQKGLAYYRLKNYVESEKAYLKSIEFNSKNATTLSNLGSLYFDMKKYSAAKSTFEKAVRVNPNHIDAISNYASTLGTLGEFNSAITYFKKAIAINPNEPNYYQMVGVTYQNLGNQPQANIYLKKAQQLRNSIK